MNTELKDMLLKRSQESIETHKRYMHAFDIKDISVFHHYVTDNPQFHDNFVLHDVIEQFRFLTVENG